jgi:methionyl-tRNA formyltransferase
MSELGTSIAYVTYNPSGPFTQSLRAGFADAGVHPAHLIVVSPRERLAAEWRRRRLGIVTHTLVPQTRAVARARLGATSDGVAPPPDTGPEPEVVRVPRLNGPETLEIIRDRGIRYLVNSGAGIFREPLVSRPDLVIVNAHAGRLPAFRNMNVVEWALYTGAPVVGTVHRIDAGIDTGAILLERPLDLSAARSVEAARAIAFDQVARLVGPAVVAHAQGTLEERAQPPEGTRWYVMHPRIRARLEQRLSERG